MPCAPARKRVKLHQYPCAVCKQNCANDSVQCGSCKSWAHALCEGITVGELNVLSGNYNFMCRVCIQNNDGEEYNYMNALFRLNEAASLSVDHLRVVAHREKCLLPPLQISHVKDTSSLRIDFTALGYLECNSRKETDTLQPFMTTGDGNCLFNALSIGLCGSETLSAEIRARTCIEMSVNCDYYTTQTYAKDFSLCSPSFAEATANCAKLGGYSSAWTIQAASDALQCTINAVYPFVNGEADFQAKLLTRTHEPQHNENSSEALCVMWSRLGCSGRIWLPNHFVPLMSRKPEKVSTPAKSINDASMTCDESRINNHSIFHDEENVVNVSTTTASSNIGDLSDDTYADCDDTSSSRENHIAGTYSLPAGRPLSSEQIMDIIVSEIPAVNKIPLGVKENVYVVLDNSENTKRKSAKQPKHYWDDCGAWDYRKGRCVKTKFMMKGDGPTKKLVQVIVKDDVVYTETHEKGSKALKQVIPQPEKTDIVIFTRYYTALKRQPSYRKRVTHVDGSFNSDVAIVEYTGQYATSEVPHGNAKVCTETYERTNPQTLQRIRKEVQHQKPSDVYGKLTDPAKNESINYPRDIRQCQNAKARVKAEKRGGVGSKNVADELLNVIRMLSDKHPYVAEIIHSRDNPLPSVICYTNEQILDLKSFLSSKEGVVGIDRTFSLGKCFVTTTVYKSNKVLRKGTGDAPILLGPLMLHWDGRQQNYFRFFSHLRGVLGMEIKNIEMILGTDDERAMINAIDMAFPGCSKKLCSKHLKDNILRQMTDKIPKSTIDRKEIVDMIFGANGVATANDSATFDERNIKFKNNLEEQRHSDFLQYYVRHVEDKLANYVISSDEEKLWTNNNTESMNHRLKVKLNWEPRKTDELVEKIFELVKVEMVDLRRALYGTGNFCLNTRFSKFKITKLSWTSKTEEEKQQLFSKFLSASTTSVSELTSSDGKYTVHKDPKVAKKPNQRTRCRSTKTRSK